jgi:hypothetical protein
MAQPKLRTALLLLSLAAPLAAATDILMVADELPAMDVLSKQLKTRIVSTTTITTQDKMPADLSVYPVVMVYIHKDIGEPAEQAFIDYAKNGGKLILLHHSISSGKRKNQFWFPFLNISLPTGDLASGGYKYFDPATFQVVNLAPQHFITTNKVTWPETAAYDGHECPAFTLTDTEIYLNHVFSGPRTTLLGAKYETYMQPTAGWYRPAGKGTVMYFMPGHKATDFDNPTYTQILANAVYFTK